MSYKESKVYPLAILQSADNDEPYYGLNASLFTMPSDLLCNMKIKEMGFN